MTFRPKQVKLYRSLRLRQNGKVGDCGSSDPDALGVGEAVAAPGAAYRDFRLNVPSATIYGSLQEIRRERRSGSAPASQNRRPRLLPFVLPSVVDRAILCVTPAAPALDCTGPLRAPAHRSGAVSSRRSPPDTHRLRTRQPWDPPRNHPAAQRPGAAQEEAVERVDGVGDAERAIVVRIRRVRAYRLRFVTEEGAERHHGVAEVNRPIGGRVPPFEMVLTASRWRWSDSSRSQRSRSRRRHRLPRKGATLRPVCSARS